MENEPNWNGFLNWLNRKNIKTDLLDINFLNLVIKYQKILDKQFKDLSSSWFNKNIPV